jgi:hypothetical protein
MHCNKTQCAGCNDLLLLDHLVGDGEHAGRNDKVERFGGLEVDHQLEGGPV